MFPTKPLHYTRIRRLSVLRVHTRCPSRNGARIAQFLALHPSPQSQQPLVHSDLSDVRARWLHELDESAHSIAHAHHAVVLGTISLSSRDGLMVVEKLIVQTRMIDAMKKRVEDFRTNAFASAMCHLLEHMTVLRAALLRRRSGTED